jgi:F-type H+-transporting ATPase subunit delta
MPVPHRIYASALFDAAGTEHRETVRAELAEFVQAVDEIPELSALIHNPQLDRRAKTGALEAVLGGVHPLVCNFLRLLVDKGRIGEIHAIQRELEALCRRAEGVLNVELTTAFELSDEERRSIVGQIEQASGRKVEATAAVDPGLIGGLVLQAGSLRVDSSVRGRLERLRRELQQTALRD